MNPEINRETRIQKAPACTFHGQDLMRKKGWKENQSIISRHNIYKGALQAARGWRMKTKYTARKRFRERMEIIHRSDYATATLSVRKRIDMPQEKSTIAMSDQLDFDFARYEWFGAKLAENSG